MKIILQKIIAGSGYCSRRQAEKMINAGKVKVNGQTAEPGDMADPVADKITIKGKLIASPAEKVYIKLNKPAGYTCTNRRFPGEKNIFDLVRVPERLFAVGRLDKDSRGLVLLTNDGDLALRLAHPKFLHSKIYEVRVSSKEKIPASITGQLVKGVELGEGDGFGRAKKASLLEITQSAGRASGKYLQKALFIITLSEGKKRQIRRMFQALQMHVLDIKRVDFAGLRLGELPEGRWEYVSPEDLSILKDEKQKEKPTQNSERRRKNIGIFKKRRP